MRPKLCFVAAAEVTVTAFLSAHLAALAEHFDVSLAVNTANRGLLSALGVPGTLYPVAIERPISPVADTRALFALTRLFRRERFDAVHSVTPKAGLLAMVAARMAGVRVRTHTFTGQVWATRAGAGRHLLKIMDRVIADSATFLLVDSPSQREFLRREGVLGADRSGVLGEGSIVGVDAERFRADPMERRRIRAELDVSDDAVLFLYLGRLTRDKGVLDLADAFARVLAKRNDVVLLFAGPDEEGIGEAIRERLGVAAPKARFIGFTSCPEHYFAAADVFCLPSYREGFGTVIIEAAAAGVPAIASRIYGIVDAVQEGVTGLLHPPGDAAAIAELALRLAGSPSLRRQLGEQAQHRALNAFPTERLTAALVEYYLSRVPGTRGEGSRR